MSINKDIENLKEIIARLHIILQPVDLTKMDDNQIVLDLSKHLNIAAGDISIEKFNSVLFFNKSMKRIEIIIPDYQAVMPT